MTLNRKEWEQRQLKLKIAEVGQKHHLDRLVDDPDYVVRATVAYSGRHQDHLDKLVHDPNSKVREAVAMVGNDSNRNKLVKDRDHSVRMVVASHGNQQHVYSLLYDPAPHVRNQAFRKSSDATLFKFFKSTAEEHSKHKMMVDEHARLLIHNNAAEHSDDMLSAIIDNHNVSLYTKSILAKKVSSEDHLEKLSKHPVWNVRYGVAMNPDLHQNITPKKQSIIDVLKRDEDMDVREAASRGLI